jgi:NitT/TauT family transport system substrate-binding protein
MGQARADFARREVLAGAAGLALAAPLAVGCAGRQKGYFRFMTSWTAQAEHGGFYQAVATQRYRRAGLRVDLRGGGAQINALQLLLADRVDAIMGYDVQTLLAVANHLPVVAVAACFQSDLQGVLTHPDVSDLSGLAGHTVLVNAGGNSSWWPWLKARYGLRQDQARPYSYSLQPFFSSDKVAMGAYLTDEPFIAAKAKVPARFFRFSDLGYPPYGATIVTTRAVIERQPEDLRRFVKASLEGWRDYLDHPAPGNAMIHRANPRIHQDVIDYAIARMKAARLIDGGDAATLGLGAMTEARWKATADVLVNAGLMRTDAPWRDAFTTAFLPKAVAA